MEVMSVFAKQRTDTGGGTGRRLRSMERVPAVLYGSKMDSALLTIDCKKFEKDLLHLKGENVIIDLTIEGSEEKPRVFLREIQRDPASGDILHLDLLRIDETRRMHFSVPVHHIGSCEGVIMGGILNQHLRNLDIRCLACDLPSHIDADVSNLLMHKSLHVSDIIIPEAVEVLNSTTDVVFTVLPPKKIEEEEEEAAADIAEKEEEEPEVTSEKKEEGREKRKTEIKK